MRWVISLLAAATLCGCQDLMLKTPSSGQVPITLPTETATMPTTAPATAPAVPPRPPASQPKPKTIAQSAVMGEATIQVNDRFLSLEDILHAAALELSKIPPGVPESSFRQQAEKILVEEIRRQVSQALAMPEAEKSFTEEQKKLIDDEIADTLAEMVSGAGGSKKKLEADLVRQGTTLQTVLDNQRRELTVRWFLRMKFAHAVVITRSLLWDYYSRNKEEFTTPKKVQMQLIIVPLTAFLSPGSGQPSASELAAARAAARAKIDRAAAALRNKEGFSSVADRYSSNNKPGGIWPLMSIGSFRQEEVEHVAFSQPPGQVSDAIETDEGFYIIKTIAVHEEAVVRFEDAQPAIEQKLRDQQSATLYNEYYAKLVKSATIVQPTDFISMAVEKAVRRYRNQQPPPLPATAPSPAGN